MRFGKKFIGFCGYFAISRKYFFEYQLLAPIRSLKDGITFLKLNINWDRYEDNRKPSFKITYYTREPYLLPKLVHGKTDAFYKTLSEDLSLFGHLDPENFTVENYKSHTAIKAPLSN